MLVYWHGVEAQTYSPVQINTKWGYQNAQTKKLAVSNLDQAHPFSDGLALAQKKGKWGGYGSDLQIVIPFKYDKLTRISTAYITAQDGNKLYLLNNDGSFISDQAFSDIALLNGTSDTFVIADVNGKYGILSSNGNLLIPPSFDSPLQTLDAPNLLLTHRRNGDSYYAGIIDLNGFIVVPFEFVFIQVYGKNSIKATKPNGSASFYTLDGMFIYDGYGMEHLVVDKSFILVIKEKEQVLLNRSTGFSHTAEKWYRLGAWYYGKNKEDKNTVVFTDNGSRFTLKGQVYLKHQHDGHIRVSKKTDKGYRFGLIDSLGNEVLKPNLLDLREWNRYWAVIKEKDQKLYSLYDMSTKRVVLDAAYTNIELLPCGYIRLFNKDQRSYLNSRLESFDPEQHENTDNLPQYYGWSYQQRQELERKYRQYAQGKAMTDYSYEADDCGSRYYDFSEIQRIGLILDQYGKDPLENRLHFSVVIDNTRKEGLLDFNGKVIVPPLYRGLGYHQSGYIPFYTSFDLEYKSKSVAGLLDVDGNIVLTPVYDKIERAVNGVAIVVVHGLYQMVDIKSKQVLLTKYQRIWFSEDGYFRLNKHGLQGMADRYGKILIKPVYTELSNKPDNTGMYTAEKNDQKFYVDLEGNEYPRSE